MCYAPTTSHSNEDYLAFLDSVQRLLTDSYLRRARLPGSVNNKSRRVILIGDLNAKVGRRLADETYVGHHGFGQRNERGQFLVDFCEENRLYIMNSRYKKRETRKWTWISPNMQVRNTIDYVLCRDPTVFLDVDVAGSFAFVSDHRLLMAKIRLPTKQIRRHKPPRHKGQLNKPLYSIALADIVNASRMSSYNEITEAITTAAAVATQPEQKSSILSDRTRSLFQRRHHLKSRAASPITRVEFSVVSKALRVSLKDDIRRRHLNTMQEAVHNGRSLRKAIEKNTFTRTQLTQLQAADGTIARNQAQVGEIVRHFYNNLFAATVPPQHQIFVADDHLPPVIVSEVEAAIKKMKKGRSPGPDAVTAEMLQAGVDSLSHPLAALFNECLENCYIPDQLPDSTISLIFKKGSNLDIANYRPIALLSTIYKVFTTVIGMRMENDLDRNQPAEQAGFRKNFSTTDHIQAVSELIQKSSEYQFPLYLIFIDFKKAFDSVEFDAVWRSLKNQAVHATLINIIQKIYSTALVDVKVGHHQVPIEVRRGVRQGDTISPQLFAAVVEDVFRRLDWEEKGININGSRLNHLRYADDIVLISHDPDEVSEMLQELADASKEVGLLINTGKTQAMTNTAELPLLLNGTPLSYVDQFIYLGQRLSFDQNPSIELQRRTRAGWYAFNKYYDFLTNKKVHLRLKRKVYQSCIEPALLYGCETWALRLQDRRRLIVTQRKMMRKMIGITLLDRRTNEWLQNTVKLPDVRARVIRKKWNWARKIALMEPERWTRRLIEWRPMECQRPIRRPKTRWRDELKERLGEAWMSAARDNPILWRTSISHQIDYILIME